MIGKEVKYSTWGDLEEKIPPYFFRRLSGRWLYRLVLAEIKSAGAVTKYLSIDTYRS
jgi:hypothetical protein